ncbi:MAG: hypothetical protein ACK53V_15080 [Planctomycetota bacterium]
MSRGKSGRRAAEIPSPRDGTPLPCGESRGSVLLLAWLETSSREGDGILWVDGTGVGVNRLSYSQPAG